MEDDLVAAVVAVSCGGQVVGATELVAASR